MKADQWRWLIVDDVLITLGTEGSMPDDDWRRCIADLEAKHVKRWIVTVLGTFDVTSVQRKLGIDAIIRNKVRLALVSEDRLVRGLATAASWFGVDVKSFAWKELDGALKHLNIRSPLDTRVLVAVKQLKSEFVK